MAAGAIVTGCSSSQPLHVRLDAGPAVAAFVTPIHVTVSGLPPGGLITVRARTTDYKGRPWQSAAQFRASRVGTLDLATAVPVSGSYHVADAGGLLWSLRPAFGRNPDIQFYEGDTGFIVRLQVLADGTVQATRSLRRVAVPPTSTQTVRQDGFASTLFAPARPRRGAPAVVVIGGSEGGEPTLQASALAAAGYPALALGYFAEPGLPKCLCEIPLEYFARAVRWLRTQPVARGRPIILSGASRGGEGALLIASYEPHLFDAVIASSPSAVVNGQYGPGATLAGAAWTWHGKPLPGIQIPVSRIRVPLLIGDGGQDAIWPAAAYARQITSELEAAHHAAAYTDLYFPQAGHAFLGSAPYFPYAGYYVPPAAAGGIPAANAQALEESWAHMIKFIDNLQRH